MRRVSHCAVLADAAVETAARDATVPAQQEQQAADTAQSQRASHDAPAADAAAPSSSPAGPTRSRFISDPTHVRSKKTSNALGLFPPGLGLDAETVEALIRDGWGVDGPASAAHAADAQAARARLVDKRAKSMLYLPSVRLSLDLRRVTYGFQQSCALPLPASARRPADAHTHHDGTEPQSSPVGLSAAAVGPQSSGSSASASGAHRSRAHARASRASWECNAAGAEASHASARTETPYQSLSDNLEAQPKSGIVSSSQCVVDGGVLHPPQDGQAGHAHMAEARDLSQGHGDVHTKGAGAQRVSMDGVERPGAAASSVKGGSTRGRSQPGSPAAAAAQGADVVATPDAASAAGPSQPRAGRLLATVTSPRRLSAQMVERRQSGAHYQDTAMQPAGAAQAPGIAPAGAPATAAAQPMPAPLAPGTTQQVMHMLLTRRRAMMAQINAMVQHHDIYAQTATYPQWLPALAAQQPAAGPSTPAGPGLQQQPAQPAAPPYQTPLAAAQPPVAAALPRHSGSPPREHQPAGRLGELQQQQGAGLQGGAATAGAVPVQLPAVHIAMPQQAPQGAQTSQRPKVSSVTLMELIGKGASGQVYRGEQPHCSLYVQANTSSTPHRTIARCLNAFAILSPTPKAAL